MFPASAGMNRRGTPLRDEAADVPRVRGDEPMQPGPFSWFQVVPRVRGDEPLTDEAAACTMFPACAGMNRWRISVTRVTRSDVPRVRGDEP